MLYSIYIGGIVERGKEKGGGNMVVFLWRNCYAEGFGIYKQTNRKSKKKNMKISATDLNTPSARTTTRVFDVLNIQMSS